MEHFDDANRGGKASERKSFDSNQTSPNAGDDQSFATSPFGPAVFDPSLYAAAQRVRQKQTDLRRKKQTGQGGNDTGRADKWQLLRALAEARASFGLSDRSIMVLEALTSFHQQRELDGSSPIVVFPSNKELALRARGMAHPTLRRHLAALVDAGLIIRRDSPNGKRYACRNGAGQIEHAFGFDLSPFALEAGAIYEAAELAKAQALALSRVRGEITVHLRDIRALVDCGLSEREEEREAALWSDYADRLGALSGRVSRTAPIEEHQHRLAHLVRLRAEVENTWLDGLSEDTLYDQENKEMSGNDAVNERHIQNSNTDHNFDKSNEMEKEAPEVKSADRMVERSREALNRSPEEAGSDWAEHEGPEGSAAATERTLPAVRDVPPLARVLTLCPDVEAYAKAGKIENWQDLIRTVDLVRSMLGVSADAWQAAQRIMGTQATAVTIACILQRGEAIKAPGGYLRALTTRAEQGKFTLTPMLKALEGDG